MVIVSDLGPRLTTFKKEIKLIFVEFLFISCSSLIHFDFVERLADHQFYFDLYQADIAT